MDEDQDHDELLSQLISTFESDEEDLSSTENLCAKDVPLSAEKPVDISKSERAHKLEEVDLFSGNTNPNAAHNVSKLSDASNLSQKLFGDDSDDEDFVAPEKQSSLSEHGQEIKKLLASSSSRPGVSDRPQTTVSNKWKVNSSVEKNLDSQKTVKEPLLGLTIINPKVSTDFLRKAASGKELVALSMVLKAVPKLEKQHKDWITLGVLASKTETKRSVKANSEYIIFRLADMHSVDSEISLFLFGQSYRQHWKIPVGTAIGLMNPNILKSDKFSSLTLSINDASQLMVIGTCKDFGTCRSVTKNGKICTNVVNKSICDKCRFHTMKEHKASSHRRSELNSAYGSREPASSRDRLMNKLSTSRQTDENIMYGGKCFSTKVKPKTSVNLKGILSRSEQKGNLASTLNLYKLKSADQERLSAVKREKKSKQDEQLEELISRPTTASMHFVTHLIKKEIDGLQTQDKAALTIKSMKPAELLKMERKKLADLKKAKKTANQLSAIQDLVVIDSINSTSPTSAVKMSAEEYKKLLDKKRAAAVIKSKGGITKEDANATRKKLTESQKEQIKRKIADDKETPSAKKGKLDPVDMNSKEYLELRNKKSINSHLVQQVEQDRETQYFNTLEKKESYETKLLDTHCIEATLYYCPQCDYQDFKLADRCFQERHNYKKLPCLKRFFKCNDCSERLVTYEKFPTVSCKKCHGRSFGKAGMIAERKVALAGDELSVRGNEEMTIGTFESKVNLDIT